MTNYCLNSCFTIIDSKLELRKWSYHKKFCLMESIDFDCMSLSWNLEHFHFWLLLITWKLFYSERAVTESLAPCNWGKTILVFRNWVRSLRQTFLFLSSKISLCKVKGRDSPCGGLSWLRLYTPNAEDPGSIPSQGTRSCTPQQRPGTAK